MDGAASIEERTMRWRWAAAGAVLALAVGACSSGPFTIEWYPASGCTGDGTMIILASGSVQTVGEVQYQMSSAGMPSMWCEGLVHQFQDGAEISDWVFGSDASDPLTFEVTADGYVYVGGTGSVTDPEGSVTQLP
jgi:hypothetical protein